MVVDHVRIYTMEMEIFMRSDKVSHERGVKKEVGNTYIGTTVTTNSLNGQTYGTSAMSFEFLNPSPLSANSRNLPC